MNSTSRPLTILTDNSGYRLTREQLLFDLYIAFYDAARHKHKMAYVQKFERDLRENLEELCDDLRDIGHAEASINSYLGVLSHSASYNIRHHLFDEIDGDIIKAA